jgi:hypothetical protein
VWRRSGSETPFSSTGPISVNVTGPPSAALTTAWLTSTSPGLAYSAIRAASLARLPSVHRRDRGVYLARLASAYALSGSPDTSVPKGWEALTVAQATGSRRITTELSQLGSRLARWESMPEVAQLLKELQAA